MKLLVSCCLPADKKTCKENLLENEAFSGIKEKGERHDS
jgi:hypothetical protein